MDARADQMRQRSLWTSASGMPPRAGDLVGFSGSDLLADAINLATLGLPRWGLSHVGILIEHRYFGICLAESTTLASQPCLVAGRVVSGAQLQPIIRRVEQYRGRVWHYPLRLPLGMPLVSALSAYLIGLIEAECPYDTIGAARSRSTLYAAVHRWKHGREDLRSLFCSELVAAAWARFDLFETTNASGWSPNALVRAARRQDVVLPPYRWK